MSKVDWDVVRPELRKMSKGDILDMLGRAYELVSDEDVPYVLGRWVPLDCRRSPGSAGFGPARVSECCGPKESVRVR